MNNNDLVQKFGYSEMYEWSEIPETKLGVFVTFDKNVPNKIKPFNTHTDETILGISSINSIIDSDDPDVWKYKYMCNEVGDLFLKKEKLAVGQKVYDEVLELNYIQTRPWEHFIPIENKYFDESKQYIPRSGRQEWVRVNLMGKVIVRDNGKCVPGQYCQPYTGKLKKELGTAIPYEDGDHKYYVMERLSEKTILILNKNMK